MPRTAVSVLLALVLHAGCAAPRAEPARSASPAASATPTPSSDPTATPAPTETATATPRPNVADDVPSEHGWFRGSWSSDPQTPPINVVHQWVLHIETAEGEPVEGAIVTIDGDMPAHGHGMPTQPQVTADLGGGDYRVEGMAFQMGGYWIIDLSVTAGEQTDLIRFGLDL
jgi:hypothetical protein